MEKNPDLMQVMERYVALGPDFLTWLFVRILKGDVPPPPSEPALKIDIKGPLQFASDSGEATKVTLAGKDDVPTAPEVFSALRQGKRLFRARLVFNVHSSEQSFTLDASTFDIKSAKLDVPKELGLDEQTFTRHQAVLHLYHLLDELFEGFLPLRLNPDIWKEEIKSWRNLAEELF